LGYLTETPDFTGEDKWGERRRTESGWGNWFEGIGQVCKSWHTVTQKRRSNPSHIMFLARHSKAEHWPTYGGRAIREIQTSYKTYKKLHSIYVGNRVIQNKTQAHKLVNILCDLVPTLKKLHFPNTTTAIGLRAAKTLAMRGLGLRDSIQLVTWLHGLPTTGAKDFLSLMRDSPRATVIHVLEGCEQIALLNLVTQGYLPEKPLQERGGHPVGDQLLPYTLVLDQELFPRLTYMQHLITHIGDLTTHIQRTTKNIITYDPLKDVGDEYIPRPRPFSTHPQLRPTVKKEILSDPHEPGNPLQPGDLEYDDLLEFHGYDEERGLREIILEKGTEIEIAIEDELGATTWIPGRVTSTQQGSLEFQAAFRGCVINTGIWSWSRNRADMEATWRLPPPLRRRQPSIFIILTTQGYTPWHHPQHGSHWLRLQPRGVWQYTTHNVHCIKRGKTYGWRRGLSTMNMDVGNSGGGDFSFDSAIEDHMNEEDLGPEASVQDRSDLRALREDLRHWIRSLNPLVTTMQGVNRWSQVPPRSRNISCFHASTMVRMYTITPGAPQYKRMDKLVKKDKLWTRRDRRNRSDYGYAICQNFRFSWEFNILSFFRRL